MAKTGRPTDNPKTHNFVVRLADEEFELLELCCEKTGLKKADVIRQGIRKIAKEN